MIYKSLSNLSFASEARFLDNISYSLSKIISDLNPESNNNAEVLMLMYPAIMKSFQNQMINCKLGMPNNENHDGLKRVLNEPNDKYLNLKKIKNNFFNNSYFKNYDAITFDNSNDKILYASQNNISIKLSRYYEWFENSKNILDNNQFQGITKDINSNIIEILTSNLKLLNLILPNKNLLEIDNTLKNSFVSYKIHLNQLDKKKLPKFFLSGTMNQPFNRIFAWAMHKIGNLTIGFDHGTSTGLWQHSEQVDVEFDLCDKYVSYGKRIIDGLQITNRNAARCRKNHIPKLISRKSKLKKNKIKKNNLDQVIYVPSIYRDSSNSNNHNPPLLETDIQKKLQTDLIHNLRNKFNKIVVKPHPETDLKEMSFLFKDNDIDLCTKNFESLELDKEVLIFDYPQTTAFKSALISNNPIIIIDLPRLKWIEDTKKDLIKRVSFLNVKEINDYSFSIDWSHLSSTIQEAREKINNNNFIFQDYF